MITGTLLLSQAHRSTPSVTCPTWQAALLQTRRPSKQPNMHTLSIQVVNKERTSLAADMWSFGMLVWELATGLDITAFPPLSVTVQVGMGGVVVWCRSVWECDGGVMLEQSYGLTLRPCRRFW